MFCIFTTTLSNTILLLVCIVALLNSGQSQAQYVYMPYCSEQAQVQALAATVQIRTDHWIGSGVIVHQQGQYAYVLTAAHVIDAAPQSLQCHLFYVDQRWPNIWASYSAEVISANHTTDVAVLRVKKGNVLLPQLRVARTMPTLPLDGFSVGCGGCRPAEITPRRVCSRHLVFSHGSRMTCTLPASEGGQSGGPLIDSKGEVIGLCCMGQNNKSWWVSLDSMHVVLDDIVFDTVFLKKLRANSLGKWY